MLVETVTVHTPQVRAAILAQHAVDNALPLGMDGIVPHPQRLLGELPGSKVQRGDKELAHVLTGLGPAQVEELWVASAKLPAQVRRQLPIPLAAETRFQGNRVGRPRVQRLIRKEDGLLALHGPAPGHLGLKMKVRLEAGGIGLPGKDHADGRGDGHMRLVLLRQHLNDTHVGGNNGHGRGQEARAGKRQQKPQDPGATEAATDLWLDPAVVCSSRFFCRLVACAPRLRRIRLGTHSMLLYHGIWCSVKARGGFKRSGSSFSRQGHHRLL